MPIFYTDTGSLGRLEVTGSAIISASGPALTLIGSGSGILNISGATGGILTISDRTVNENRLFAVSSASLDILTVTSARTVNIIGSGSGILKVSGTLGELLNVSEKTAANPTLFAVTYLGDTLLQVNDNKRTSISGSLVVTGSITGSLLGTASFATTSSFATTASFALNAGGGAGSGFPFSGSAIITGSIILSSASAFFPIVTASEALTAGDFVNMAGGGIRRASSTDTTRQAHGFVTESYSTGNSVVVFYSGLNTGVTGLTVGSRYFLGTSGGETLTPPTTAGQLSQEVGVAVTSTALLVNFGPAIVT